MNVIESLIKLNISEECFDSILDKCYEAMCINETSADKVQGLVNGREQAYGDDRSAQNKYKLARTYIAVGDWQKRNEKREAKKHLEELKKAADDERSGETERRNKVEALKNIYKHGNSKKAEEEHANAMINQYNRNKLEKIAQK